MKAFKRTLIAILMIFCLAAPCFANMPVIDITAIAQALTSYYQTLTEWQTQLKQWQSEYDRIQKAAKGIAEGDYTQVLANVASLSKQVSSWNLGENVFKAEWVDDAFEATGDGTYSILSICQDTALLKNNFDSIISLMQKNAKKIKDGEGASSNKDATFWNGVGQVANDSSNVLDIANSVLDMNKAITQYVLNLGGDITDLGEEFDSLFNIEPDEYAELIEKMQTNTLTQVAQVSDTESLKKKVDEKYTAYTNAKQEYLKVKKTTEGIENEAYTQAEKDMNLALEDYNQLLEVYNWSKEIDSTISKVKKNQDAYEEAENYSDRYKAYQQLESSLAEYQRKVQSERYQNIVENFNVAVSTTSGESLR